MNVQRKRIQSARFSSTATETAARILSMPFRDAPSVNIHGVNISMGVTPFGPDETLLGRWYVVLLPSSIALDTSILNDWIANLDTITSANTKLNASEFVWGAGSFVCGEQSVWQHEFAPKTSRNVMKDGELFVILVADAVSGAIDNYDMVATISLFTSS